MYDGMIWLSNSLTVGNGQLYSTPFSVGNTCGPVLRLTEPYKELKTINLNINGYNCENVFVNNPILITSPISCISGQIAIKLPNGYKKIDDIDESLQDVFIDNTTKKNSNSGMIYQLYSSDAPTVTFDVVSSKLIQDGKRYTMKSAKKLNVDSTSELDIVNRYYYPSLYNYETNNSGYIFGDCYIRLGTDRTYTDGISSSPSLTKVNPDEFYINLDKYNIDKSGVIVNLYKNDIIVSSIDLSSSINKPLGNNSKFPYYLSFLNTPSSLVTTGFQFNVALKEEMFDVPVFS
jgi:hypothetical protein